MNLKPQGVAEIHREICARENCRFLDKLDYEADCAACPDGHWGRYGAAECGDTPLSISAVGRAPAKGVSLPPISSIRQPGDLMAALIFRITGQMAGTCGPCAGRVRQMNQWGWMRSWLNRKIILSWLTEEAAKRGHPIDQPSLLELLRVAFKEARRGKSLS